MHRSAGGMQIANRNDLMGRKQSSILSSDVKDTWNGSSIVYQECIRLREE